MSGRIPILSGSNFDIKTDGICHCPNNVPIIYIGMPKDMLKKIKSNKCQLCGGLIVPKEMKGGLIKTKHESTKDRAKAKPKSRRLRKR